MTTPTQRDVEMAREMLSWMGYGNDANEPANRIATALAAAREDGRREGMEEAAIAVCTLCRMGIERCDTTDFAALRAIEATGCWCSGERAADGSIDGNRHAPQCPARIAAEGVEVTT